MKRVAVRNSFLLQTHESFIKVPARKSKCQVIIAFRAPRRELDSEIFADSDYREWTILTFELEAEHIDVKIDAVSNLINVENYVINRSHRLYVFLPNLWRQRRLKRRRTSIAVSSRSQWG